MQNFLRKLTFFCVPLGLLVFPPLIPLTVSGEFFQDLDEVIKEGESFLIGYTYNEKNYNYLKWKTLQSKKTFSVVALGSSRVLLFRKEMFTSSFYNAGFTIRRIKDFLPFLQSLPEEKYPQYLIIGLDQWMFNKNWDNLSTALNKNYWISSFSEIPRGVYLKLTWEDLLRNKYDLFPPKKSDTLVYVGLNAVVHQTGMKKDGSMYYGSFNQIAANDDYQFEKTFEKIKNNEGRFKKGPGVNIDALKELENLLRFCNNKNIKVIGFLPPFATAVNEHFQMQKGYHFIHDIFLPAKAIFTEFNHELYDFTEIAEIKGTDKEMIDGFHGSEVIYVRMLIEILSEKSDLNNVADVDALRDDLERRKDDYFVY